MTSPLICRRMDGRTNKSPHSSQFLLNRQGLGNISREMLFYIPMPSAGVEVTYQRLKLINKNKIFKHLHSSNFVINYRRN